MGLFDYLKRIFPAVRERRYRAWAAGTTPLFSPYGNDVYLSDFVNNAIDRVASEISKINVVSVVTSGSAVYPQRDDITRLFRFRPNPLQTTSDFLSNVEWLRRKRRNAFIYPQFEEVVGLGGRTFRRYLAFYPLNPSMVRIGVAETGEVWEVEFTFEDGAVYTLPYADLIHLRWRRGVNTVLGGGDDYGMANDRDLLRVVDALDKTIQGLPKSIEASLQISGVYTAKTVADAARLSTMRSELDSHISKSPYGIIATDLAGEFVPVNIKAADIPADALNFLKTVIRERYGVSEAILSGDYSGEQHSAFYQTAIEDFINQFEQAASSALFSLREQDVGHRIKCYYSKVAYMNTADKLALAGLAKETGIMTLNQINEMFGAEPFEGGNRRVQSLNFMNVELVDDYQISMAGAERPQKEEKNDGTGET